jgi:uncharacterized membrane protein
MVPPLDFLDSMAWTVAISAVLLGVGALTLRYNSKDETVDDQTRRVRMGLAAATGATGFYLFITGAMISFMWPFTSSSGVYNILFGGIATLGGLVLLAGSIALYVNADLRFIAYFAAVVGVYGIIDAYAIIVNSLTNEPLISALAYLSFVALAILSVPAAHFGAKRWRVIFALFAFLFAAVWLFEASSFTLAHLTP